MEPSSEKYLKKLFWKSDIAETLKRLDRLTQVEARMADAQLLKATNMINHGVRVVADNVLVVVDRSSEAVVNGVRAVDDKVAAVNDGAEYIRYPSS